MRKVVATRCAAVRVARIERLDIARRLQECKTDLEHENHES